MSRAIEIHGLTPEQGAVVDGIVDAGSLEKACEAVGFDNEVAQRLFREHTGFQNAVLEALRVAQVQDAIKAQSVLRYMLRKRGVEDNVRLRAAKDVLDRGVGKATEHVLHQHEHRHTLDRDGLLERIATLSGELGLSPDKLLESPKEADGNG